MQDYKDDILWCLVDGEAQISTSEEGYVIGLFKISLQFVPKHNFQFWIQKQIQQIPSYCTIHSC